MTTSNDYPRMLFHRTKDPVTVQSRDEENALGKGWSRTIWPPIPDPEPELLAPETEPEEEASAFEPQPKHHKPTRKHR